MKFMKAVVQVTLSTMDTYISVAFDSKMHCEVFDFILTTKDNLENNKELLRSRKPKSSDK